MKFKTLDQRRKKINDLLEHRDKSAETFRIHLNGEKYRCPIINIQPQYILFRLNNTRTIGSQLQHATERDLADDFFDSSKSEHKEVQEQQFEILKKMVDKTLEEAFKDGQLDPLLVNKDGFIINGNRRFALMLRENYPSIEIAVTNDPILFGRELEIEAAIDPMEDVRVPFIWYAEGLSMKRLLDDGKTISEIKKLKGLTSDGQVTNLIMAAELARERLEDAGTPNKWDDVEKSEQIYVTTYTGGLRSMEGYQKDVFKEIVKCVDRCTHVQGQSKHTLVQNVTRNKDVIEKVSEPYTKIEPKVDPFTNEETENKIFDKKKFQEHISNQDKVDKKVEDINEIIGATKAEKKEQSAREELSKISKDVSKKLQNLKTIIKNQGIEDFDITPSKVISESKDSIKILQDFIEYLNK